VKSRHPRSRLDEAQEAGAQAVVLAPGVGGVTGAGTYLAAIDYDVKTLAKALR
jgi:hypothetical protein